jgi:hypothetical protein
MNTPKQNARKELERRRANLPTRPIHTPPPRPAAAPMSTGRWLVILVFLAAMGWCAGWGLSTLTRQDEPQASGLKNLPTKSQVLARRNTTDRSAVADAAVNAAPSAAANQDPSANFADKAFATGPYRTGEVLFSANSPESLAALLQRAQAAGGTVVGTIQQANAARLSFPDAASMADFLRGGAGGDAVPNPELNFDVTLPTDPNVPIDPYAPGSLRPFGNSALSYMGVPSNNLTWGQGMTIAMLDTGLSPGTTNILTGGSITQYDMTGSADAPPVGHGDMVVSLFTGANGEQGIVPAASIMSVRVLDANDQGNVYGVTDGIYTAIANGAQVLSLSLGTNATSTLLQNAINYALSQNVIVVAAAGNDGNGQISYPAAYPGVIAVGSVDATGQRATFSDYGPQMTISAPGVGLNTVTTNGTMSFSGTSASAPLVAGAIAGLVSTNPNMTGQQALNLLTQYADFAGPVTASGTNEFYGAGVINVGRVLTRGNISLTDVAVADMYLNVTSMPTTPTAPMQISIQNRGNTVLGTVQVTVDVNGTPTSQTLTGMAPNEVQAVNVDLPVADLLTAPGVQVSARADLVGQADTNPANNEKARVVHLVSAAPSTGS